MIAWPNPPKTCQEAIDLAIWLEQVKPSCKLKTIITCQLDAPIRLRELGRRHGGYFY